MAQKMEYAWKVVRPDFYTRNGYRWPFPGRWAYAPEDHINAENTDPCPSQDGDGLCLAKTWAGAASGGMPVIIALHVGFFRRDVLGEDEHKLRVRKAKVLDVLDPPALARAGYLRNADLRSADLRNADLRRADLYGADLRRADLRNADLCNADLRSATLYGADLYGADLRSATLYGANLYGADLRNADLRSARNVPAHVKEMLK